MHGFGQVAVHAGFEAAFAVAFHGVGRHCHDGGAGDAGGFPFANPGGGVEAAHDRHLDVHQDQVVAVAGMQVEGFLTVVGHVHLMAEFAEQAQGKGLVHHIVFG